MSLNCDGVLEDESPCNGTFDVSDKFCKFCGKRKDNVKKIHEPIKTDDPTSEANRHGKESEITRDIIPTEASKIQAETCKESDVITEDPDVERGSDSTQEETNDKSNTEMKEIGGMPNSPGISEDEMRELEEIAKIDLAQLKEYIKRKNNEWKNINLHIGVTGVSGVGKSSFINAIRGVKPGHPAYAKVDINETTTEVTPYPHPEHQNLIFWDMPGAGTNSFPRKDYLKTGQFEKFDFFLILFHKRFHEDVTWLAQQVKLLGKRCFFVRTHTHVDVKNDRKENPNNHSTQATLDRIRKNAITNLEDTGMKTEEVFLIDNNKIYLYDFNKLTAKLFDEIPDEKRREAFVLALSSVSESVINEKKKALEKRIVRVAFVSAVVGTVPVPLLGAAVDTVMIMDEAKEYRKQFDLTPQALNAKFPGSKVREFCDRFLLISSQALFTITADEAAESYNKIPVIGSLIASVLSYRVTVLTLRKILNALVEDAHEVNRMTIELLSGKTTRI